MKIVSVVPFYSSGLNNCFFDNKNIYNFPYELKKHFELNEFQVNTVDISPIKHSDFILMFDLKLKYILSMLFQGKLNKCIYISFEPPSVYSLHEPLVLKVLSNLFFSVLTWQDEIVDDKNIFKFYFPMPKVQKITNDLSFNEKKLLTTVVGYKTSTHPDELYSKRVDAILFFEQHIPKQFDFYGAGWDESRYQCYRGKVDSKLETMAKYRFTLCYENQHSIKGLISEKIFDCFHAKSIPIFWGASNIEKYIPADCFVDKREFPTYESLLNYLSSMTEEEFGHRIKAINKYLLSDEYKLHSSESFAQNLYKVLNVDKVDTPFYSKVLPLIHIAYLKIINKIKRKLRDFY
tara:strand:- start:12526 stop:13569 length:1044 start_codon:yes stop_codon:yes gene_type:complete